MARIVNEVARKINTGMKEFAISKVWKINEAIMKWLKRCRYKHKLTVRNSFRIPYHWLSIDFFFFLAKARMSEALTCGISSVSLHFEIEFCQGQLRQIYRRNSVVHVI